MIKRTYAGIIMVKSEIIKRIGENLDLRLFRRDCNGHSYYGCCVDPLDGAVIVLTKDVEGSTVRMIFDNDSYVRVECGDDKHLLYPFDNSNRITLNQVLKEVFNVPYVSRDDFEWDKIANSYRWRIFGFVDMWWLLVY